MDLYGKIRRLTRKNKIIMCVIAAAVVTAVVICISVARKGYLANTMRLLHVEGIVNIETSGGGTKPVTGNIRFQSGDALNTGSDGLASVGLDDTKIITLKNNSRAEFKKNGKQLELNLTKGAVFFNVTEKLKPDETLEIKTSTMTAGIRGTSGIIYCDEKDGRDSVIVTDGSVEVTAVNPATGETKHARVEGGQRIKVFLYKDTTDSHDTVEFYLDEITEEELPDFSVQLIAENEELLNRVCEYTGWDKETLKELVEDIVSGEAEGEEIELTPTPEPLDTPTPPPAPGPASATPTPPSPTPGPASPTPTPPPPTPRAPTPTPSIVTPAPPTETPYDVPEAPFNPTNTPTNTPTPTTVSSSEPAMPSGCTSLPAGWDKEYDGHKVYICYDDNGTYYGYYNGRWMEVTVSASADDPEGKGYFYIKDTGYLYFETRRT